MRFLYYTWDEVVSCDLVDGLKNLGHSIVYFKYPLKDKLNDLEFFQALKEFITQSDYDFIITFNYFPIISKAANACKIKYISWVYDSPHLTLYSKTIFNDYNYIFSFDKAEVIRLQKYGVKHIWHMPLAVNTKRLNKLLPNSPSYTYDVTFLGNLYNNNFFNQIKKIPEYYQGFFDGIIQTQMKLYGYDLTSDMITDEHYEQIKKFVRCQPDNEIFLSEREFFIQLLQEKITSVERISLLKELSNYYPVTLFSEKNDVSLQNVNFHGYADYEKQMPFIFYNSKINLNITLRSILSGISLRCLDIMGSGGFLLSNYQPELAEFFQNGIEMVIYESKEDLCEKTRYYLSHENERREIAECGRKKIIDLYSYEKKLEEILKICTL